VEDAEITFVKGELWKQNEDTSRRVVLFEDTVTVKILELQNGATEKLVELEIPADEYKHLRLFVLDASITIKVQGKFKMKVPSGASSGLKVKIDPAVVVKSGLTSELLIDFDISRSFVMQGNMNTPAGIKGFIFKQVIRAVNNSVAGRIQGFVRDTANVFLESAELWSERDTITAKTFSDATGYYGMIGIPAGDYKLFAVAEGYDTLSMDVSILEANVTEQDVILFPSVED
jgi:hypothetical protein